MENSKRVFYGRIRLLLNKFKFGFLRDEINSEVPYCLYLLLKWISLSYLVISRTDRIELV